MKKKINDIFLEKIIKNKNITILIDFWANWCSSCKMLNNIINEIKIIYKKKIKIIKINVDYNYYSVEKFSIKNIPTLILIKNKMILMKKFGFINKDYLKKILKKTINGEK